MATTALRTRVRVAGLLREAQVALEEANRLAFADQEAFAIGFLDRLHILVLEGQGLRRELWVKEGIPQVIEAPHA